MVTVNETVFVDGTFEADNIIYGRTLAPSGSSDTTRTVDVSFSDHGVSELAGTGDVTVVVTAYTQNVGNRTSDTGVTNSTAIDATPTGFTLCVHRMNTASTWVYWLALRQP